MNRLFSLSFFVLLVICLAVPGYARGDSGFVDEGEVSPTAKSAEPYQPERILEQSAEGWPTREGTISVEADARAFPEIVLYLTVTGPDGGPMEGLDADDFIVTEQSSEETSATEQILTSFEALGGCGAQTGMDFVLVIDISASMKGEPLSRTRAAAIEFLSSAGDKDRAALVTFSNEAVEEIPLQAVDTDANSNGEMDIIEAVSDLSEWRMTALYDGTAEGIASLEGSDRAKAVIMFTDGDTNRDRFYSINEAIAKANAGEVPLFPIGIGDNHSRENLNQMASATGGKYYDNPSASDMAAIYREIASIAGASSACYRLGYSTHNPVFDGTTRTVRVSVDELTGTGTYTVDFAPLIALDAETLVLNETSQRPNKALTISGTITDLDARPLGQALSGHLFYRNPQAGSYVRTDLAISDNMDGTYRFTAEIPADDVVEPEIEYYLSATDGCHTAFSPETYQTAPYLIRVSQNMLPQIVHTPVTKATASFPVMITAGITDPDGTVMKGTLYYRVFSATDGSYETISMADAGGGNYTAQIPAGDVTVAGVEYYLTATDDRDGMSSSGSAEAPYFISVTDDNQPPTADAGEDMTAYSGDEVVLDGTGSFDPDSDEPLSYVWQQESGPGAELNNADTASASFIAPDVTQKVTALVFSLTVSDAGNATATDSVRVLVSPRVPTAAFAWSPQTPVQEEEIQFTDTSSSPNGAITSRNWDFAGEGASTGANPVFSFSEAGAYSVTLQVTDAAGLTDSVSHIIDVDPREECPDGDCGSGGCFITAGRPGGGFSNPPAAYGLIALFGLGLVSILLSKGRATWKAGKAFAERRRGKRAAAMLTLLLCLAAGFFAGKARAEIYPGSVCLSPMVTSYTFDDRQDIDAAILAGFGLGYNLTERLGLELMLNASFYDLDFNYRDPLTCLCEEDDADAFIAHADLVYHFRPDKRLVPYLAAGAGGAWLGYDSFDDEEEFLLDYGAGLKYFISDNTMLRGDLRHIYLPAESDNNLAVSLGLSFRLGGAPEKAVKQAAEPEPPVEAKAPEPEKKAGLAPATPEPAQKPEKEAKPVRMENIFIRFEFDKSEIRPVYYDELTRVALFMKDHLDARVLIEGHTDSIGTEKYNMALGRRRAESVKRYLTETMNIKSERIRIKSYGEKRPVASNKTPEGRQKNRRTVIIHLLEETTN